MQLRDILLRQIPACALAGRGHYAALVVTGNCLDGTRLQLCHANGALVEVTNLLLANDVVIATRDNKLIAAPVPRSLELKLTPGPGLIGLRVHDYPVAFLAQWLTYGAPTHLISGDELNLDELQRCELPQPDPSFYPGLAA